MKKNLFFPCFAFIALTSLTGCNPGGGGGKAKNFTVKFETYSGTPKPEDQIVKEGNCATRPSVDPGTIITEEGDEYTFVDWYTSPETMEKFNFSNPITCDTTVYAHYDGGYQMDGKTNVDYNNYDDSNLKFTVKNKSGNEVTGFTFETYFPDFPDTKISIDNTTGKLYIPDEEDKYIYGFVYAYRENSKTSVGYDYAIKPIHIASFDCLKYTKIDGTDNYEVSYNEDYKYDKSPHFTFCIPNVYYTDEEGVLGSITEVCTSTGAKFGEFLSGEHTKFATLYIPDTIEEIGENAFGAENYDKSSGAYIRHISSNIKNIGAKAFKYCNGDYKTSFNYDFSNTKLETIGDQAFNNAYIKDKAIKLPATLKLVGRYAFTSGEYTRPKTIEFVDAKNWISNNDSTMNILNLSDPYQNVRYLSNNYDQAVIHCSGVQKAIINQDAFKYNFGSAPNTLTVTGIDMSKVKPFSHEAEAKAATIPATIIYGGQTYTVTEIGKGAFQNNTEINNIYLSDTIESIGDEAFSGCTALRSLHLTKNVRSLGEKIFDNCCLLNSLSVDKDNNYFASTEANTHLHTYSDAIYSKDYSILYYGSTAIANTDETRKLPLALKEIKSRAFYGRYNANLTEHKDSTGIKGSINFPANLNHIGADAFTNAFNFDDSSIYGHGYNIKFLNTTNLWTFTKGSDVLTGKRVNITDEVLNYFKNNQYTSYDWKYNAEGSKLEYDYNTSTKQCYVKSMGQCEDDNITIPSLSENCKVTKVGKNVFKDKTDIKSISIGDNVETLDASSFENCIGLTELVIPKSVTQIGGIKSVAPRVWVPDTNVFRGCTNLAKVYMEDSSSTWEYGHYTTVPSKTIPGAWTYEFTRDGTFTFSGNASADAKLLTDYETGSKAFYTWKKIV